MGEVLQDIVAWLEVMSPVWVYVSILLIAYLENVIPPIPGDMVVVFGGYLAGIGQLHLALVILLSTLGGALGFMTMYLIGYRIGDAVVESRRLRWVSASHLERTRQWIDRWGYGLIAANRFLSGFRSVISLAVGITRVDRWYTALFATLSAFVWTALIAGAGYVVGENWSLVRSWLRDYGLVMTALIGLALCIRVMRWRCKRKARGRGAGSEGRKSPNE